jgi:hypothetical protein
MSNPNYSSPLFLAYILAMTSLASKPALSERILGITSKAAANFL